MLRKEITLLRYSDDASLKPENEDDSDDELSAWLYLDLVQNAWQTIRTLDTPVIFKLKVDEYVCNKEWNLSRKA